MKKVRFVLKSQVVETSAGRERKTLCTDNFFIIINVDNWYENINSLNGLFGLPGDARLVCMLKYVRMFYGTT